MPVKVNQFVWLTRDNFQEVFQFIKEMFEGKPARRILLYGREGHEVSGVGTVYMDNNPAGSDETLSFTLAVIETGGPYRGKTFAVGGLPFWLGEDEVVVRFDFGPSGTDMYKLMK